NRAHRCSRARQQHFASDRGQCRSACANADVFRGEFGQAEIEDLSLDAARYKNIGWLDVAMNDALCMGGIERVGNLNSEVEHLVERERLLADAMLQRLA